MDRSVKLRVTVLLSVFALLISFSAANDSLDNFNVVDTFDATITGGESTEAEVEFENTEDEEIDLAYQLNVTSEKDMDGEEFHLDSDLISDGELMNVDCERTLLENEVLSFECESILNPNSQNSLELEAGSNFAIAPDVYSFEALFKAEEVEDSEDGGGDGGTTESSGTSVDLTADDEDQNGGGSGTFSPEVSFSAETELLEALFEDQTEVDETVVQQRQWDFGNGSTAEGEVAEHLYEEPGVYEVTLTLTDTEGNEASGSEEVLVESDQAFETDQIEEDEDSDDEVGAQEQPATGGAAAAATEFWWLWLLLLPLLAIMYLKRAAVKQMAVQRYPF